MRTISCHCSEVVHIRPNFSPGPSVSGEDGFRGSAGVKKPRIDVKGSVFTMHTGGAFCRSTCFVRRTTAVGNSLDAEFVCPMRLELCGAVAGPTMMCSSWKRRGCHLDSKDEVFLQGGTSQSDRAKAEHISAQILLTERSRSPAIPMNTSGTSSSRYLMYTGSSSARRNWSRKLGSMMVAPVMPVVSVTPIKLLGAAGMIMKECLSKLQLVDPSPVLTRAGRWNSLESR